MIGIITESRSERGIISSLLRCGDDVVAVTPDTPVGAEYKWLVAFGDRLGQLQILLHHLELRPYTRIAHIHGGDWEESGHIDNRTRSALTAYAHLHFPAHKRSLERLLEMGVRRDSMFCFGSPAIDDCVGVKRWESLGPLEVVLLNPTREVVADLKKLDDYLAEGGPDVYRVFITPNGDPGSEYILMYYKMLGRRPVNLARHDFLHLLAGNQTTLVGNSSAMYIEGSYFRVPFVQIGARNLGRSYGGYGSGDSAARIIKVLRSGYVPGV